jgi:hypothetical protein
MAWRINQIKLIGLTILRFVAQSNGLRLNCDTTLTLQVELIEELGLHLASLQRACGLKDSIGKCGLTVVDMGDDTEISDFISWRHDYVLL